MEDACVKNLLIGSTFGAGPRRVGGGGGGEQVKEGGGGSAVVVEIFFGIQLGVMHNRWRSVVDTDMGTEQLPKKFPTRPFLFFVRFFLSPHTETSRVDVWWITG